MERVREIVEEERGNSEKSESGVQGVLGVEWLGVEAGIEVGTEFEVVGVVGVLGKGLEEDDDMVW